MTVPPDISVVVPTRDRAGALIGCLQALAAQTLADGRFEVIVCDDGSAEPVTCALAALPGALVRRLRLRTLRQDGTGPAAARNRGALEARGRWLAFTDDDCRPEPDWLERLLARFAVHGDVLIGGGFGVAPGADSYARATQAIMDFVYADQERRGGMKLFSTSNLALTAAAFTRLDGFSLVFPRAGGEDYDLCARWQALGGQAVFAPEVHVSHTHALSLGAYVRQHFAYGRGLLRMRRRLRALGVDLARARRLQGASAALFYLRLVSAPLRRAGGAGLREAVLIGLSQFATAAGGLRESLWPPHEDGVNLPTIPTA